MIRNYSKTKLEILYKTIAKIKLVDLNQTGLAPKRSNSKFQSALPVLNFVSKL